MFYPEQDYFPSPKILWALITPHTLHCILLLSLSLLSLHHTKRSVAVTNETRKLTCASLFSCIVHQPEGLRLYSLHGHSFSR